MTENRNSDQITLGFACLDLTCLNMYNGRDDCVETNRAITWIILRSVNPGYCITTDTTLVSGGASGLGGKERDRSWERFAQSQTPAVRIHKKSIHLLLNLAALWCTALCIVRINSDTTLTVYVRVPLLSLCSANPVMYIYIFALHHLIHFPWLTHYLSGWEEQISPARLWNLLLPV